MINLIKSAVCNWLAPGYKNIEQGQIQIFIAGGMMSIDRGFIKNSAVVRVQYKEVRKRYG